MKTYKVELTEAEIALISYCLGHAKNYNEQATKIVSKFYRAINVREVMNDIINKGETE